MHASLAVIAPNLGAASETFIRRHMENLLPGQTAVIAGQDGPPYCGHWTVGEPKLITSRQVSRYERLVRRMMSRPPFRMASYEDAVVARFLSRHQVRVMLLEFLDFGLPYLELARKLGIRCFGHAHGYDVSASWLEDPKWKTEYQRYCQAHGVVTPCEVNRQRLIKLGLDAGKVHVVPYGVEVPAAPKQVIPNASIRCVAVGRMVGKKAPILLLDAFRRAAERVPGLTLDYVGAGILLVAAIHFVRSFSLSDRVTLHGTQPSAAVTKLMADADIFLQHSVVDPVNGDEEGMPVAILEAMAAGLPVVSTRHAGIPEAVIDGETGLLVDEGDSVAMSEAIQRLALDPQLRQTFGTRSWERASAEFSWPRERERLLQIMGLV